MAGACDFDCESAQENAHVAGTTPRRGLNERFVMSNASSAYRQYINAAKLAVVLARFPVERAPTGWPFFIVQLANGSQVGTPIFRSTEPYAGEWLFRQKATIDANTFASVCRFVWKDSGQLVNEKVYVDTLRALGIRPGKEWPSGTEARDVLKQKEAAQ